MRLPLFVQRSARLLAVAGLVALMPLVVAAESLPAAGALDESAFRDGLRQRGLTDWLEQYLSDTPPVDEIDAQLRRRESLLDQAARTGLSEPERRATATEAAARDRGLSWLAENQRADGAWGKTYPTAVTSFACLAYLASAREPFAGPHASSLVKGIRFLVSRQKDGLFVVNLNEIGNINSWIIEMRFEGDEVTLSMKDATGLGSAEFGGRLKD